MVRSGKPPFYNIFNNHSRTEKVVGYGSSGSCSETCPYDGNCSGNLNCVDTENYPKYMSGTLYSGKALVISASADGGPCFSPTSKQQDYDGDMCLVQCNYSALTYDITQTGSIIVGGNGDYAYYTWKGKCETGTWQDGNWDKSFDFVSSISVGKYYYDSKSPTGKASGKEHYSWSSSGVAVRYFKI